MISRERINEIINQLTQGTPIRMIVPTAAERVAFYDAVRNNKEIKSSYQNALQLIGEMSALEVIGIADSEPDLYRANLQINTRKWFASKVKPEQWGDKIQMEVTHHSALSDALAAATRRLLPGRDLPIEVESKIIETIEQSNAIETDFKSVNQPSDSQQSNASSELTLDELLS